MIYTNKIVNVQPYYFIFHLNSPTKKTQRNVSNIFSCISLWRFELWTGIFVYPWWTYFMCQMKCCNPSLGLATKARAYKVVSQEGSLGVTSHAPRSARGCEKINPHTPNGTPTLGSWSPGGLPNFQRMISQVKTQWIEELLYHWKDLGT
jgi:hypothetical protein